MALSKAEKADRRPGSAVRKAALSSSGSTPSSRRVAFRVRRVTRAWDGCRVGSLVGAGAVGSRVGSAEGSGVG